MSVSRSPLFGVVLAAFLLESVPAEACSMGIDARYSVDPAGWLFVGRVSGYVPAIVRKGLPFDESYPGLLVEPLTQFQGPVLKNRRIELYPYGLAPNCGPSPPDAAKFKSRYAPGTKIRILAEPGGMNRKDGSPDPAPMSTSDPDPASTEPFEYPSVPRPFAGAYGEALDFEVMKDLVRLRAASSDSERATVLKRLGKLADYQGKGCERLVKENIASVDAARRLSEACRATHPDPS